MPAGGAALSAEGQRQPPGKGGGHCPERIRALKIGFSLPSSCFVMWEIAMQSAGRTASIVPYGADETIYLVIDRRGGRGIADRETEFERTDIETILAELLSGQFNDPVRVIAFNTLEHWSDDISQEIACEIQIRSDIEGAAVPEHVRDFVTNHEGRAPALIRA
jgi:hypothetical protein